MATDLAGNACERLGTLTLRSRDGRAVASFDPGSNGFELGAYSMQGDLAIAPVGWLTAPDVGVSLVTATGTTLITGMSEAEVIGAIDWIVALPPDLNVLPDTALGIVRLRGTFAAQRIGPRAGC